MTRAPRRILVVDDEPGLVNLVRRRAERAGLQVSGASSIGEGFALATADPPDLILVDVHLPDGHGFSLLTRLQADPRTAHIPVVVWSGSDPSGSQTDTDQAGAAAYFDKSDIKHLVAKFVELLDDGS
jgi:CheY-like chemotaxis protein